MKKRIISNNLRKQFLDPNALDYKLEFPQEIKDNYLKIVTNVFYLNIKEVSLRFKEEFFEKPLTSSQEELLKLVNDYYLELLPKVRAKVYKFFNIEDKYDVPSLIYVRNYNSFLPKDDPIVKAENEYRNILFKVENNLTLKIIPEEFIDSSSVFYTNEPKDVK